MQSSRSYGEACAAAHALDLVGERWALLVVRELIFGPKRFSDLRAGLPQIGPNRLSQRLRSLEAAGILARRQLGPPVGSPVYELTEWGQELEPVLIHLGRWGRRSPFRDLTAHLGVDALMLALRGDFDADLGADLTASYTLRFGTDTFALHAAVGRLTILRGEAPAPDATVDTDPATFAEVLTRRLPLTEATDTRRLTLTGDPTAFQHLLDALPRPQRVQMTAQ